MTKVIPTFEHSVSVLVKAFINDTLEHGNCYACAVGNLVANANGYRYTKCTDSDPMHKIALTENGGSYRWGTKGGEWYEAVDPYTGSIDLLPISTIAEIESIGYTVNEVILIEHAFESANNGPTGDRMFNGLMAVCDALAEIHGIDLKTKEEAKKLFVKV